MNQIPVFDYDVTTANMVMWARSWISEGPLNIWFATTHQPISVETPTLESRLLYQSWPSGAVLPIYLIASILGIDPSAPMINWFNTANHGLIALAVAFTAFHLCRLNRLSAISSAVFAVATSFLILLPRGLGYAFAQLYGVTIAVFPYIALFILLEALYHRTGKSPERTLVQIVQILVITFAFFVDWLAYTVYISWLFIRILGGYIGAMPRWSRLQLACLTALPIITFSIYLFWRFATTKSYGVWDSVILLVWKIGNRMNFLNDEFQIPNFPEVFWQMHEQWFSAHVPKLMIMSTGLAVILSVLNYLMAQSDADRRRVYITAAFAFLLIVPFYGHSIILSQHTGIHRWTISRIMFAYSTVPFVIIPIMVLSFFRSAVDQLSTASYPATLVSRFIWYISALFISVIFLWGAINSANNNFEPRPFMMGRIQNDVYDAHDTIRRVVEYNDIVFSSVWQALPISVHVGITNKRIYKANNFADVDKLLEKFQVCGNYRVVVLVPVASGINSFDGRPAELIYDEGQVRFMYFPSHVVPRPSKCS